MRRRVEMDDGQPGPAERSGLRGCAMLGTGRAPGAASATADR
jgi:hypothetical protein